MLIEERHQAILSILAARGSITNPEIQKEFGISYDSAKRDLRILEEKGLLKRTHGGALPIRQVAAGRPAKLTIKDMTEIKENYWAIAKRAVSMIEEGDVIYIPAATVGLFMVQNIPADLHIRVVTNSIVLAQEMRAKDNIRVILLGGEMDERGNCCDAIAIEQVRKLRYDKCFMTAAGISAGFGMSIQKSQAISYKNAAMDSARVSIGLFPREKIGFDSIVSICPASRLDCLITDWDTSPEDIRSLEEQGLDVIVVEREACPFGM